MPSVSVIMSVYNGERYLREAIESILRQDFRDFEFLIMNDGSTDNSASILWEYETKDPRVKVYNQENKGLNKSLNKLIAESSGRYLARMDADDISEPARLSIQVEYMERHPECAFVVGGSLVMDGDGTVINGKYLIDDDAKLRMILFSGERNPFTHGSIVFRKDHLLDIGIIYRFRYSQDFDLLLRLASKHKIGSVEKIVYRYREGSSLQKDFLLNLKRKQQNIFLLDAYKQDRLFDDDHCISNVEKIHLQDLRDRLKSRDAMKFEISRSRVCLKTFSLRARQKT